MLDEVVGMLITLALLPVNLTGAIVGFLVFRVLDVVKPWPSGRFERLPGGLGVMADDGMAAVYGNLVMRILMAVAPAGWLVVTPFRRAAILAVGSELLTPSKLDTNSLFITEQLNRLGIDVVLKAVVGDDRGTSSRTRFAARSSASISSSCCGGLGPTDDDVTREVVAAALERPLSEDEAITARLRARFKARGFAMPMPEINRRQAMVPAGARRDRERATAARPACGSSDGAQCVLLLPGPPRELKPMLAALVEGRLRDACARASRWCGA